MKQFAQIISVVFHPIAMPLLCILVGSQFDWYIQGTSSMDQLILVYIIVALSTIAFPGINILLLRWYGSMSSLESPEKKERMIPYFSSVFFYILGYYLLRKGSIPMSLYSIFLGSGFTLVVMALISMRWKISAHSAGIFGLIGTLLALFQIHDFENLILLSTAIFIGGLVLTARLILKVHTPVQVYVGAAIGFFCLYITVRYGLVI